MPSNGAVQYPLGRFLPAEYVCRRAWKSATRPAASRYVRENVFSRFLRTFSDGASSSYFLLPGLQVRPPLALPDTPLGDRCQRMMARAGGALDMR